MKKIYTLITLLFLSGVIFGQAQRIDGKLSSVKPAKGINSIHVLQTKAVTDSLHYDGANNSAIGTGGATSFGAYAFFPATILAPQAALGHYILSEKLYIMGVGTVTSAELRFYTDTLATALVYSQAFTPVEGWNNVTLASPFLIPSTGNLYVGYYMTVTGGYPAGCDSIGSLTYPDGNWIDFGSWGHLSTLSATLLGNWNIRAMVGTLPLTPTPYCTPLAWAAGNVPITTSVTSGNFTLSNIGSDTLICTGITGLSAPFTTSLVPFADSLITGANKTFTFTYNPTIAGQNNDTVVIITNGGNITIYLSGTGTNCGLISTFPWEESFEGPFPTACWTFASLDGGTGWAKIASGTTPLPGFTGGTMSVPAGGGTNAVYCTWTTGGATANDQWLITPQIAVQPNQDLTFYIYRFGVYQDMVDIKISTTTNATSSFTTTLLSLDTTQLAGDTWSMKTIHLTSYAGQNVYIAFNEHVADNQVDGAFIGVDLVKVDSASANPIALCTPLTWAAGDVSIATTVTSGNFTLKNDGQGTLTCSGISGISAPFTTTLVPASVNLAAGATTTFTFSYNPTVVGVDNQTMVIATNGGNITINLSGTGTNCGAISTFPWTESFEDATFPPSCWTKASPDGGTGWSSVALGTTPLPGWTGGTVSVPNGGGTKIAYGTWNTGGATSNNQWLITPQIAVQANQELSFYMYWFGHFADMVDIKVSTTTNASASFTTTLLSIDTNQLVHDGWQHFTIPLTSYAGQNVYFAFNEHVADNTNEGAFIGLDLVKVDSTSVNPLASCTPSSWTAGNVPITTTVTSGTFTLKNDGVSILTCSGISGLAAPFTTTLVPASVNLAAGATTTFTFSYNPTIAGTNNQTVVIATNGGNITINLSGTGTSCGTAISTFPWTESFEDAVFPPTCWTKASPDGGTGWATVASGTTPFPGWTGGTVTVPTGGGTKVAYCTWNTGGAASNNQWLITPKIAVQANQDLIFYLFWNGNFQDLLDVKVSTTTNNVADFTTTVLSLDSSQFEASAWKQYIVHLTSYASQNVYFAFNEHVANNQTDGAFIGLDLITVQAATGITEAKEDLVSIFPNPATDKLYIVANTVKSVEIYNIMGANVASYGNTHVINIADLAVGSYIVKVVTDSKVITKKINITR